MWFYSYVLFLEQLNSICTIIRYKKYSWDNLSQLSAKINSVLDEPIVLSSAGLTLIETWNIYFHKNMHLQKSTYNYAIILMWSLYKHFCLLGQLNKTNPKYNYNPYNYNYANIHYRNKISAYLTINSIRRNKYQWNKSNAFKQKVSVSFVRGNKFQWNKCTAFR